MEYDPECMDSAYAAFCQKYPNFESTSILDDLRRSDYDRLDRLGQVYLDFTGGGLYAMRQVEQHMELLRDNVFGNPHSQNPTSQASTRLVEQARHAVLAFFHADPDEYAVIFTPNASGALKLVGEAYPFAPGGRYLPLFDNHNSVNGIREFARAKGAQVTYVPLTLPEMRLDESELSKQLAQTQPGSHNLLAYPAQSNFSGVQHPLEWIERAHALGWDVLLDCAAFAPTNRLDLGRWKPDFVPLSFYKIFGYPTGTGCLLARKEALSKLQRPWFAGGTISITSVQGEGWHYLLEGQAGFEDGTVNYLNLPAVEIGLRHIEAAGIETIHERVSCLTGWLLENMAGLRHDNGERLVQIYGPELLEARGGTIAFSFNDPSGAHLDYRRIEKLASEAGISLRTGCFCNPGAGETAHHLSREDMAQAFGRAEAVSFDAFYQMAKDQMGKAPSTLRISLGLVTNFADAYRFMTFASAFANVTAAEIDAIHMAPVCPGNHRDSA